MTILMCMLVFTVYVYKKYADEYLSIPVGFGICFPQDV